MSPMICGVARWAIAAISMIRIAEIAKEKYPRGQSLANCRTTGFVRFAAALNTNSPAWPNRRHKAGCPKMSRKNKALSLFASKGPCSCGFLFSRPFGLCRRRAGSRIQESPLRVPLARPAPASQGSATTDMRGCCKMCKKFWTLLRAALFAGWRHPCKKRDGYMIKGKSAHKL